MKYFIAVFDKENTLKNTYVRENSYLKTTPTSIKSTIQNLMRELGEHESDYFQGQIIEIPIFPVVEREVKYLKCWAFGNVHKDNPLKITIRTSGIHPFLYPKVYEAVIKTKSMGKPKTSDDRDFILTQENLLEDLHSADYTLVLTTGIDMRFYHETYNLIHTKKIGINLYNKGKRVTIIAIPEKYSITSTSPFSIDHLSLEKLIGAKLVKVIPFKIERYLE